MLRVELKRILKTRATWWLFAIAFVLCIFFAFYAVRLSTYSYYDENGQAQFTRGTEAYELNKEKNSFIEGEITPELISEAVRVYHEVIRSTATLTMSRRKLAAKRWHLICRYILGWGGRFQTKAEQASLSGTSPRSRR